MLIVNVGSGDMLSSITAAYLTVGDTPVVSSALAAKFFSLAGANAAQQAVGLGQWQMYFFDELSQLDSQQLANQLAKERDDNNDK